MAAIDTVSDMYLVGVKNLTTTYLVYRLGSVKGHSYGKTAYPNRP